jgi:hypothetical protein
VPYSLYERVKGNTYKQQGNIHLFGAKEGMLYHSIRTDLPKARERNQDIFWVRSASDIISSIGFDPDVHAAVVDLAPNRKDEVLFGIVRGMAGCTGQMWTPIVLLLELIHQWGERIVRKDMVSFSEAESRCCTMLYAQGGWATETYSQYAGQGEQTILRPAPFGHLTTCGLTWIEAGRITTETRFEQRPYLSR